MPALFLIDTGAAAHAIAPWLVSAAGLHTRAAVEQASDIAGRTSQLRIATHPAIALDGWGPTADVPAMVVPFPPFFEEARIGGVLSPQWLAHAGEAILLDLAGDKMLLLPDAEAEQMFQQMGGTPLSTVAAKRCGSETQNLPNATFALPVVIGGQAASLSVDTGSDGLRLRAASPAGRALLAQAAAGASSKSESGVSGTYQVKRIAGVSVQIGAYQTHADLSLIPGQPPASCPSHGNLGMDTLRHCRVLLSAAGLSARCDP